ncbi:MAG: hypothetical protein IH986_15020, partial [Planctomycetes bacterium]|nr:hypothetical protein [Planctomycetota bacterium]
MSVSLFMIVFLLVQHHTLAPCEILRRDLTFGLGREYIVAVMPGASEEEISEAAVLEVVTPIVDEELANVTDITRRVIDSITEALPQRDAENIFFRNAARLYDFDLDYLAAHQD